MHHIFKNSFPLILLYLIIMYYLYFFYWSFNGCLTQTPSSLWRQYEEMQELENIIDVNFPFNSKFLGIMDFSNVPSSKTESTKNLKTEIIELNFTLKSGKCSTTWTLLKLCNLNFIVNSNYPEFWLHNEPTGSPSPNILFLTGTD